MLDPYKILGVAKTASQDEIKKAYRKLAKSLHPDLNPGNKEAEKKFKDLSHAFDLIGTKESREKFDRGETNEQQNQQGPRYSHNFDERFNTDDLFAHLFSGGRRDRRGFSGMNIPGEDELYQLDVDFTEAALGGEKVITLPNGKKLSVKIPAGIENGKKLKFKGLGGEGLGAAPPGDAYIQINIKPKKGFSRVGNDIYTEIPISFFEAINGAEIEVPTIEGIVMLKVPAGVSSGSKLRIKHKGAGLGESRGSHIVTLKIAIPKNIPPELKTAVNQLQRDYAYNPRGD